MRKPEPMVRLWLAALVGGGFIGCSTVPRVVMLHDPLSAQEHAVLGVAYERQDRLDLAAREYQTALRRDGMHVPALMGLGNMAYQRSAFAEAESFYRQVLALDPNHAGASNNLAMVYMGADRLAEAEALATRALEHGGALRPRILDTLVRVYVRQGQCSRATTALHEAEKATPPDEASVREQLKRTRQELRLRSCPPSAGADTIS